MIRQLVIFSVFVLSILFISCSASTDTRYAKEKKEVSTEQEVKSNIGEYDFDITPYKTEIDLPEIGKGTSKQIPDLWFDYPVDTLTNETVKTAIDTLEGFRVQVISTDDLEEANGVRSEIYFKTNEKAIYVLFEPPFYIVRVGDFLNINDAKLLNFKLNQLGFTETKVVNDLIYTYR
jgi:hypothetical protein